MSALIAGNSLSALGRRLAIGWIITDTLIRLTRSTCVSVMVRAIVLITLAYVVFIGGGMLLERYDSPTKPQSAGWVVIEEDSPLWQCARMGNFKCGS
jgi:hypothetical protein